ncbi:MAG: zf-HC2 domain-containing protein [Actinomycetota bacterium]|nr:zf-HC2 domain-containing protein [Actinomycetota bacterium]
MTPARLSCRDLVELVTDYLEGVLSEVERERFEAHVAEYDGCHAYLDQFRATVAAVGRLREDDLPEPVAGVLLHAFQDWRATHPVDPGAGDLTRRPGPEEARR